MKKIIILLIFTFGICFGQNDKEVNTRFLIQGGYEFGGEKIGYVFFDDGSEKSIKAGNGVYFGMGAEFDIIKAKGLFIRSLLSYKVESIAASNVSVRYTSLPLEFTLNYNASNKFWFGGGFTLYNAIKLNFDGLAPNEKFNSAIGPVFKMGYGAIGISYTALKIKPKNYDEKFSASNFGIFVIIPLPKKDWKK
ncbi:MAG: hypothetical protein HC854_16470 [Flavobacterium sp.]|nr:hypothetical protein [Flavobacterium sp.]